MKFQMQVTLTGIVDGLPALDIVVSDKNGSVLVPVVIKSILTADNPKLRKGEAANWLTMGAALSPHKTVDGLNVCASASAGCVAGCLDHQGMGSFQRRIHIYRAAKTWLAVNEPEIFYRLLNLDIQVAVRKAARSGQRLACRLNVFSDIMHEKDKRGRELVERWQDCQFYDYTAHLKRMLRDDRPANYHLTYSRKEKRDPQALTVLNSGKNVAVVFNHDTLPREYLGHPVEDGDLSDMRWQDKAPRVIGLKMKYASMEDAYGMINSGFAVTLPELPALVTPPAFYVSS